MTPKLYDGIPEKIFDLSTSSTSFYILILLWQYKEREELDKDRILYSINQLLEDITFEDLTIDAVQILHNAKALGELSKDTLEVAIDDMMENFKDDNNNNSK